MARVLPLTVAEMLEDELVHVHGEEHRVQHEWDFEKEEVDSRLVMERIKANALSEAYEYLHDRLGTTTTNLWEEFNKWGTELLDRKVLKSSMITRALVDMHEQVRWQQKEKKADAGEIRRVNRSILEALFPDAIVPAEKRHLQVTAARLHKKQLSAICLSGGGIRSATFSLGVLQGLARAGDKKSGRYPIEGVHYLSTVSGGGYIGGWLSAWIRNAGGKAATVFAELRQPSKYERATEPDQVRWLREYSNYLTPRFSIFSVDTATIAATWLRNVTINWLMFLPFLVVLMLLPRLMASAVTYHRGGGLPWLLAGGLLTIAAVVMIALAEPTLQTQNRPKRRWLILAIHLAILFASLLVPQFWAGLSYGNISVAAFLLFGVTIQLGGAIITAAIQVFDLTVAEYQRAKLQYDSAMVARDAAREEHELAKAQYDSAKADLERLEAQHEASPQELERARTAAATAKGESESTREKYESERKLARLRKHFRIRAVIPRRLGMMVCAAVVSGLAGGFALRMLTWWSALRPPIRIPELYALAAPPAFLLAFLLAATVFTAVASRWTVDETQEYWTRLGASLLIGAFTYVVISAISFYGPSILGYWPKVFTAIGGVTGLVGILVGRSGLSPAGDKDDRGRTVSDHVTAFVIPIFIVILLAAISGAISALFAFCWRGEFPAALDWTAAHLKVVRSTPLSAVLLFGLLVTALALTASFCVDVNKFSMHALYRMRLVRAYLGASRSERNPDPYTGFDSHDSPLLIELRQRKHGPMRVQKPFHVVNMALNLVRGKQLAWQQRKASTFTASPLHWGNWSLGYRDAKDYGKATFGLALGTAITISGAAASPNMGYHSSPPLSFLLAMFNVRLGAWLGNPGVAGGRRRWHDNLFDNGPAWRRSTPKSSIMHQLAEAFGLTDDEHQYVYLSDGGHFENLGLYEMVLRRCRYIILSDAGADPDLKFEDLGNAVRKIRIDFGIPIDFSRFTLFSRDEKKMGAHCAIGRIRYSEVDGKVEDGHLLYIKASYYASGPEDVRQYARKVRRFPHESTADQFFTESQFESYRRLGEWVIDTIVAGEAPGTMKELFAAAREYEQKHVEEPRW
ncbi:MAG TPA: hypothetical protein VGF28_04105 [Thermoanaerobaculia bacterium]|jgi:hypothetical protein